MFLLLSQAHGARLIVASPLPCCYVWLCDEFQPVLPALLPANIHTRRIHPQQAQGEDGREGEGRRTSLGFACDPPPAAAGALSLGERGETRTGPSLHWELLGTETFLTSAHRGAALQPSERWPPRDKARAS